MIQLLLHFSFFILVAHIFHFSWADEQTPQFEYAGEGELEKKAVEFDANLTLKLISGPECAGYYTDGTWRSCPHGNSGGRKCEDCKKKEGLAVAQFCDGYNLDLFSAEQLAQLNTPHYVYFALFQRDIYKIGVSALSRGFLRQIEQGTHFAMVIAEGMGGVLARQTETFFRRCGIADKIPTSQKKDFLFPEITKAEARQIFTDILDKYTSSLMFDKPEVKEFLTENPEIISFADAYHLPTAEASAKPFHAVTLKAGEMVSGKVLAVKGSFLILETDAEKILINAKDLYGYHVDFSEQPAGLQTEDAFQGALF